jgi:hypothetical protein
VIVDGLRTHVRDLSTLAAAVGQTVDPPAEETLRRLGAVEARAREYVRDDQSRLAADIIFTDARDLTDTLRSQIAGLRDGVGAWGRAQQVVVRQQQALLAAGALLIWMFVAVLLVPGGAARENGSSSVPAGPLTPSLADTAGVGAVAPARNPAQGMDDAPTDPPAVAPALAADLRAAAEICGELARVSDAEQLSTLLERSARVLNASGLIVWLGDGDVLFPVASWGYDARVLSRITSIPRDAANLTASAYRSSAARLSSADHASPAAFGVPLVGPSGPVGVLSGEVPGADRVSDDTTALAAIIAAQLVTLVGSMPPAGTAVGELGLR